MDEAEREVAEALQEPHALAGGDFALETLTLACNSVGLRLDRIANGRQSLNQLTELSDERRKGATTLGFLISPGNHWITLRKIHGTWWNLDSLGRGPQGKVTGQVAPALHTYMRAGAYVAVVREEGAQEEVSPPPAARPGRRGKDPEETCAGQQ